MDKGCWSHPTNCYDSASKHGRQISDGNDAGHLVLWAHRRVCSPRCDGWGVFHPCLHCPCAFHVKRAAGVCWPCYGYHPTCWSGWPTGCEMCPPPTSIVPTPRPAASELQVIPTPPAAENVEHPKDKTSPKDQGTGAGRRSRRCQAKRPCTNSVGPKPRPW